jgi:putative protease
MTVRKIELISPAKNLACGIEAINHGADAVYIGAPKFGARVAEGNYLEDITAKIEGRLKDTSYVKNITA